MKNFKKYKATYIIVLIFISTFIIDVILRLSNNSSVLDILLGRNETSGIYNSVWFKVNLFKQGDLWRILSWPFFSKGFISFILESVILISLFRKLEIFFKATKSIVIFISLELIIVTMSFITYSDFYNDIKLDLGIVGINVMIFALAGVVFTYTFIVNYEGFKSFSIDSILVIFYLLNYSIYSTIIYGTRYVIFYAFSFGILSALLFNIQFIKQMFKEGNFKIYKEFKSHPFTNCVIIVILIVFLLNSFVVDSELLNQQYNDTSIKAWWSYFLEGGDYGYVANFLLANMDMIKEGQIWRMVTHVFSHTGLIHVATNIPVLYFTGRFLERAIGTKRTAIIFFVSALTVSSVVLLEGSNASTLGGSSLSIYALIVVYLLYIFKDDNKVYDSKIGFIYTVLYFILGNIPSIGVFGECHLISMMVGVSATFIIKTNHVNKVCEYMV